MKEYEYVSKKEYGPVRDELLELIHSVQKEIRKEFTFSYEMIGSASRNMITRQVSGNVGYDFDMNIKPNDVKDCYSPAELKSILKKGLDKFSRLFSYDFAEDNSRVLTIKVKDKKNAQILHSCDFAIVLDSGDGKQQYVRHNKANNTYSWESQPKEYYQIEKRASILKKKGLWNDVRARYLEKKNLNKNPNKKSRAIYAETIHEIYEATFGD